MNILLLISLTALGVGGATIIGAVLGFLFKNISHKYSDIVLSFAAGVMLAAAIVGLILPSIEYGADFGNYKILVTIAGIFVGALCLNLIDKLVPHMHKLVGLGNENHNDTKLNKVILFVLAIAIHNLPEGIAAGVGFGSGNNTQALIIAGVKKGRTFLVAFLTGIIEVIGTIIGYFAVSISTALLPFALAFAGGTMLYVISDEMIPETHSHGSQRGATYALLVGFCIMLITDVLLG